MRLLLIPAVAALLATPALAADKAAHPNLSGYWNLSRTQPPEDPALAAKLPKGTVVLHDTGPAELGRGDYGGLKVKADSLAAAARWNPKDDLTVSRACAAPSIVYAMQGPFPMEVHQGADMVVFKLEYFDMVRIVFLDGRPHPPADAPHSKTGHSVGHWEGDTLVVDTTHLEAATITNNGLTHSDQVHMVERFKLSPDGKSLLSTQVFDDPQVLDAPGARFIAWTKEPGKYVYPYDCDPSFGANYR